MDCGVAIMKLPFLFFLAAIFCAIAQTPHNSIGEAATANSLASAQRPAAIGISPASGYELGPDDQIVIRCLDAQEISDKPISIDAGGHISLPLVGRFRAAGLTPEQLEAELASRLKAYVEDPKVSVSVTEFRSQPVSLIGAVAIPGVVQLRGRKNLFEVLSLAGGLRPDAGDSIKITRKLVNGRIPLPDAEDDPTRQFSVAEVNVKDVMRAKNPEENIQVMPNDVISVPKADRVYVVGEVARSGEILLGERKSMTALEALAMAGGLGSTASPKKAAILRNLPGVSQRQEIAVNLKAIANGKIPDVTMRPDDILVVPNSTGKAVLKSVLPGVVAAGTAAAVYTQGR